MLVRDGSQGEAAGPPCCIPGCTVRESGAKETCIIWGGRRLCYRDVTLWASWSEAQGVINRPPTADEWTAFVTRVTRPARGEAA